MEKVCSLIFLLVVFFQRAYSSLPEYTRQPPRPVVFTHHSRSASEPQQVHISLVGKDHMRVSWVTEDHHSQSFVEYGKMKGGPYEHSTANVGGDEGYSTNYRYFFYSSGKIHHVKIGPLEPSTTYYYKCGGRDSGPEFSLRTPPSTFPIEFAVAGDLGQTEWTSSTLAHINSRDYDVLLLPGDLSYADTQQPLWDTFGRFVEPFASHRPWMVTVGNHEVETFPIIYPKGFTAYNARWPMPHQDSGSKSNLYYSFDVVGAHVIMLASYTDFDAESQQYKWLQADLVKVNRKVTPWLIVLNHAPWYNTNVAHKGEGENMRKAMEELLFRARVDLVFSGHVHAYERFTRVYDNRENPCGPVYVTIGDGGNREGLALMFEKPSPAISVYREPSFGHGRLRILNNTHAHWSWQRNNDSNSLVADEVWFQTLSSSRSCNNVGVPLQQGRSSTSSKEEL